MKFPWISDRKDNDTTDMEVNSEKLKFIHSWNSSRAYKDITGCKFIVDETDKTTYPIIQNVTIYMYEK